VLAGPALVGVGQSSDHKATRPLPEAAGEVRACLSRVHGSTAPAAAPTPEHQLDAALRRAAMLATEGPTPPTFLPGKPGESLAAFAARLRAALDEVVQVPGCTPQTPAGRERLLTALLAHAEGLLTPVPLLTGRGLGLGPDGAEHHYLFDALMQRLFQPLARTITDASAPAAAVPTALVEAFALLESVANAGDSRPRTLLQLATSALARACGGEHMSNSTLGWFESLIFKGPSRELAPSWLDGCLTGLTLGVSSAGHRSTLRDRVDALALVHLHALGPRQIEALGKLPLPGLPPAAPAAGAAGSVRKR
jgi:hypothetical protein